VTLSFHPLATQEFDQTVNFYEQELKGLGLQFADEVEKAINLIQIYPNSWSNFGKNKRILTNRFPYAVVYKYKDTHVTILAIMHTKRKPNYFSDRK
jgi:plasmid stabilization system protein ParE